MRGAQVYALLVAAHGPGASAEGFAAAPADATGTPFVAYGRLAPTAPVGPPVLRRRLVDAYTPAKHGGQGAPRQDPERLTARRRFHREGPDHLVEEMSFRHISSGSSPKTSVFHLHRVCPFPVFGFFVTTNSVTQRMLTTLALCASARRRAKVS
jgi:hypothetical protein